MANANPVKMDSSDNVQPKPVATSKKPKKIENWSEMMDPKTGKKMRGSFEMPNGTIVTNN